VQKQVEVTWSLR